VRDGHFCRAGCGVALRVVLRVVIFGGVDDKMEKEGQAVLGCGQMSGCTKAEKLSRNMSIVVWFLSNVNV
jgi:hypothetical protein